MDQHQLIYNRMMYVAAAVVFVLFSPLVVNDWSKERKQKEKRTETSSV
jgi:hypothetical protein